MLFTFLYNGLINRISLPIIMYITLFTIGKLKDQFFAEAQSNFEKMIRPYCQLHIEELHDEPLYDSIPPSVIVQKEGERILKWMYPDRTTIVLDAQGKQYTSEQFSEKLRMYKDQGIHLQFVIGGPYGLSPEVKKKAQEVISLSSFTFPHQLARIVLLEQLYRAFTLIVGKKYHY